MVNFKHCILFFVIITATVSLKAQNMLENPDTVKLQEKQLLLKNSIVSPLLERQIFYDPLVGNYTIGSTGMTSSRGHFFIKIKEPNLHNVIPMPGAERPLQPKSRLLNPNTTSPFYSLPDKNR